MITLKLSKIAESLNASTIGDAIFHGISTDTRTISPGNLFIAIKGENHDGHNFIKNAIEKKAAAILVNRKLDHSIPQIIVKDTIAAMGILTTLWRNQFSFPFIGVTGSNGKTTLKNMIASILRAAYDDPSVLATEGNLNNNIGVPLMLARLNENHRYAVIEMGMNHFGEIAYLTQMVKPQVAVITNAASAHLEGVDNNVNGVARAKGEIFLGLTKNGIAILNRDDEFFDYWLGLLKNQQTYLTFGIEHTADVTAKLTDSPVIIIQTPQGNIEVNLSLLGKHNVMNALAATAATLAINIPLDAIKNGLEQVKSVPGRLHLYTLENNIHIIDDSYNANPGSVSAAIATLANMQGTRILILGDMKELGIGAKQLHYNIGQQALNSNIEYLFTLGELTREASKAFGKNAQHFTTHEELLAQIRPFLKENTNILIKGSLSMNMKKIVANLLPQNEQNKTEHTH